MTFYFGVILNLKQVLLGCSSLEFLGTVCAVIMAPASLANLHLNSFVIKRISAGIAKCVYIARWRESADKWKGISGIRDKSAFLPVR